MVEAKDIAEVVARWTGIPVNTMLEGEAIKLLHMEDELHERIVGQDEAIAAVADAMRRARSGSEGPASGPSAASSSWAPAASARPSWPRRWPSSCSTTRKRWSAST